MALSVLVPRQSGAAPGEGSVVDITAVRDPVVVHDGSAGWAEDPSLVVNSDYVYVAYGVSQAERSHVCLARLSRTKLPSKAEAVMIDSRGQVEFRPAMAQGADDEVWVAWTSFRDGHWAIRAARVAGTKVSSELVISDPGGFQSQAGVGAGDGVACFVWVAATPDGWSVMARIHDGKLHKPFTVHAGPAPMGRPAVRVLGRDHLVFVWDEYADGQFAIRKLEVTDGHSGTPETLSGTSGSTDWEPTMAGGPDNLVTAWSRVPADSVTCQPMVLVRGGTPMEVGLGLAGTEENWRVKCTADAHGNTLVLWTTRFLYHSTNLYVRRIGPQGMSRACNIDFPMPKLFMNVFDCELDRSLFVVWDRSGSIYLGEVTPRELERAEFLGDRLRERSEWASEAVPAVPRVKPAASSADEDDYAEPDLSAPARAVTSPGGAYSVFYQGESLHVYFGDYHNHTSFSDGRAYPDISLLIARDRRRLDFAAITDHDGGTTPGEFAWNCAVADLVTQRGKFAALHGFEVSKNWARADFGHWNMLFRAGGKLLHYADGMTPLDLYAFAKANDALVIPHHVAKRFAPHDWTYSDREAEPVVEMCSIHGIFESLKGNEGRPDIIDDRFVDDGLARGYVFGFVGGSDYHNCFMAARAERGLTGVYAGSLSPAQVFDAMKLRRTFALTGGRTILDFRCNGHLMGEAIEVGPAGEAASMPLTFTGYACSPDSIVSLEIMSERQVVWRTEGRLPEALIHWEVSAPDSQTYYYLRAATARGDLAWSSPIWIVPRR
jgi:hypothetical protein